MVINPATDPLKRVTKLSILIKKLFEVKKSTADELLATCFCDCSSFNDLKSRIHLDELSTHTKLVLLHQQSEVAIKYFDTDKIFFIAEKIKRKIQVKYEHTEFISKIYQVIGIQKNSSINNFVSNISITDVQSLYIGPDEDAVLFTIVNINAQTLCIIFTRAFFPNEYVGMRRPTRHWSEFPEFIYPPKIIWKSPKFWHDNALSFIESFQRKIRSTIQNQDTNKNLLVEEPTYSLPIVELDSNMRKHEEWQSNIFIRYNQSPILPPDAGDEILPINMPGLGNYIAVGFPVCVQDSSNYESFTIKPKYDSDNHALFSINGCLAYLGELDANDINIFPHHLDDSKFNIDTTQDNHINKKLFIRPANMMDIEIYQALDSNYYDDEELITLNTNDTKMAIDIINTISKKYYLNHTNNERNYYSASIAKKFNYDELYLFSEPNELMLPLTKSERHPDDSDLSIIYFDDLLINLIDHIGKNKIIDSLINGKLIYRKRGTLEKIISYSLKTSK